MATDVPVSSITQNERFLDVNNEPRRPLGPIEGYELEPLLSLKEIGETLKSVIPLIDSYIWSTLSNCDEQPKDELAVDESSAIRLYTTGCLHRQLNAALRATKRQQLTIYFPYLKLLLTALWKLPDFKGVVWRGVKGDLNEDYPKGKQLFWWGLSSCTQSLSILQIEEFLGEKGVRTLFNIECYDGKMIENHSNFPDEKEVLLLPCCYFEVIGNIKQNFNLRIIHLRQIQPPCVMIQPPFNCSSYIAPQKTFSHSERMTTSLSKLNVLSTPPPFTTRPDQNSRLFMNLNALKKKPKLSININRDSSSMDANNKYLLYCPERSFILLDEYGNSCLEIERTYEVWDICWSSYFNRFLILSPTVLYSLSIDEKKVEKITEFTEQMWTCTCYQEKFFVSSCTGGIIVEEYSMNNWKRKKMYTPPIACRANQYIRCIRFSNNGIYLGMMISDTNHPDYRLTFELRNPNNMKVLQVTQIGVDRNCWLLPLSNQQFMVTTLKSKKAYLLDPDGKLKETISHDVQEVWATSMLHNKTLILQTENPNELCFYDL